MNILIPFSRTLLIIVAFSCAPKLQPIQTSNFKLAIESPSQSIFEYDLAYSGLYETAGYRFEDPSDSIDFFVSKPRASWNYLNTPPIILDRTKEIYRLTKCPPFDPYEVWTVIKEGSQLSLILRRIDGNRRKPSVIVECYSEFNAGWESVFMTDMENFFWKEKLEPDKGPYFDATGWIVEGMRSNKYKMLQRIDPEPFAGVFGSGLGNAVTSDD